MHFNVSKIQLWHFSTSVTDYMSSDWSLISVIVSEGLNWSYIQYSKSNGQSDSDTVQLVQVAHESQTLWVHWRKPASEQVSSTQPG